MTTGMIIDDRYTPFTRGHAEDLIAEIAIDDPDWTYVLVPVTDHMVGFEPRFEFEGDDAWVVVVVDEDGDFLGCM
jgi:hypothetical protein